MNSLLKKIQLQGRVILLVYLTIFESLAWGLFGALAPVLESMTGTVVYAVYAPAGLFIWGALASAASLLALTGMMLRNKRSAQLGFMILFLTWMHTIIILSINSVFLGTAIAIISISQIIVAYITVTTEHFFFKEEI